MAASWGRSSTAVRHGYESTNSRILFSRTKRGVKSKSEVAAGPGCHSDTIRESDPHAGEEAPNPARGPMRGLPLGVEPVLENCPTCQAWWNPDDQAPRPPATRRIVQVNVSRARLSATNDARWLLAVVLLLLESSEKPWLDESFSRVITCMSSELRPSFATHSDNKPSAARMGMVT
ncbi:uncharacterized protein BJX67DRAFT_246518 [Aspergillus lucknowensis]|uniref:Uncharacterized protein n=1 Tax=Aspergillus lucknowensis TaxID=176173 RepID=A0ABR4M1S0_9EURO